MICNKCNSKTTVTASRLKRDASGTREREHTCRCGNVFCTAQRYDISIVFDKRKGVIPITSEEEKDLCEMTELLA